MATLYRSYARKPFAPCASVSARKLQHEPTLLPSLLVGVCRPACVLFIVAVSLRRSCHREWCLAILRLLPLQPKQVRGGFVVARVVVVCAHHNQAAD